MDLMDLMSSLNDLIDYEFELTEDGHIPPSVLRWFNACNNNLTGAALEKGRATFDYDPDVATEIALPTNFYKPIPRGGLWLDGTEVPLLDLWKSYRSGYKIWGRTLILVELSVGTLEIYYYKTLDSFVGLPVEVPEIPAQFHELYPLFGAMRFMQYERDEVEAKRDFHGEYELLKRDLEIYALSNDTAPNPVIRDPNYPSYKEDDFE